MLLLLVNWLAFFVNYIICIGFPTIKKFTGKKVSAALRPYNSSELVNNLKYYTSYIMNKETAKYPQP